jgi:hypothetical protein
MEGLSVVMGGKIDNIYDIMQAMGTLRDEASRGDSWISALFRGPRST